MCRLKRFHIIKLLGPRCILSSSRPMRTGGLRSLLKSLVWYVLIHYPRPREQERIKGTTVRSGRLTQWTDTGHRHPACSGSPWDVSVRVDEATDRPTDEVEKTLWREGGKEAGPALSAGCSCSGRKTALQPANGVGGKGVSSSLSLPLSEVSGVNPERMMVNSSNTRLLGCEHCHVVNCSFPKCQIPTKVKKLSLLEQRAKSLVDTFSGLNGSGSHITTCNKPACVWPQCLCA